jgi:hypothetical protein
MTPELHFFAEGLLAAGNAVAALFFLRFWRETKDRLFAFFAAAFALLTLQRALIVVLTGMTEYTSWIYGLRLLAYVLILIAIYDKNRSPRFEVDGGGVEARRE